MEFEVGFIRLFQDMIKIFQVMYFEGYQLYSFFSRPLADSLGSDAEMVGDIVQYTPIELMFGFGLVGVLITAFIKFFTGIFG